MVMVEALGNLLKKFSSKGLIFAFSIITRGAFENIVSPWKSSEVKLKSLQMWRLPSCNSEQCLMKKSFAFTIVTATVEMATIKTHKPIFTECAKATGDFVLIASFLLIRISFGQASHL